MDSVSQTVEFQACLLSALCLAMRWMLPGLAWSWLLPFPSRMQRATTPFWIMAAARAALIGVLISLLLAWALAEASRFFPNVEVSLLAAVTFAGLLTGFVVRKRELLLRLSEGLPGLLFVTGAFAVLLALPQRGEWIAGGWDPGIYVGEGMRVEREGTFHPVPEPFLSSLAPEEWPLFTRHQASYGFTEYLPVVPVDTETARIRPFFFRLTSTAIGVAARCGGLRAATRINLLFGLLAALMLAGLLIAHRQPAIVWLTATLLLIAHPVWLFMANFPTSEMLQLFLILSLGFLLPFRFQGRAAGWLMAGIIFAGMLNRFSFLPFAALFVCALTWMDLPRAHRDEPFRNRLLLLAAMLAGAWVDFVFCRVTLDRLGPHLPPLLIVGLAASVLAIAIETLALSPRCRHWLTRIGPRALALLFIIGVALLVAGEFSTALPWHFDLRRYVGDAMPFLGPAWIGAALLGLVVFVSRQSEGRSLAGLIFYFAASTVGTVAFLSIATLYPWASRRFLEFTVPLLSLLAALLVGALWTVPFARPFWRGLGLLLVVGLLASTARQSRDAWRHTEFDGLSPILAEVAARVGDADVVVADHFRWGTPLRLVYGRQVLNGEIWWQDGTADSTAAALRTLAAYRDDGRRIFFFTSTDQGLSVFSAPIQPVELIWDSGPVDIRELGHRVRQRRFRAVEKEKHFQLLEWTSPAPHP